LNIKKNTTDYDVIPAKPALVKTGGGNPAVKTPFHTKNVIPAKAGIQQLSCLRNSGGLCVRLFIKTSIRLLSLSK
jgi:hypothetical protein